MSTKAELEAEAQRLEEELERAKSKPSLHIEGVHIDMAPVAETNQIIAQAVLEGMKALQTLGGPSYGMYFEAGALAPVEDDSDEPDA